MNRAARRVLIVLVVATIAVGGWLMSPRFAPSIDPVGGTATASPGIAAAPTSPPTGGSIAAAPSAAPTPPHTAQPSVRLVPSQQPGGSAPTPPATTSSRRLGSPSATPMLRDVLDARLARLRTKYGLPGVSAAILFADGSIWRGTAGDADVATGVPVTPDTSFSVASVSKTFTAALILALVEDGRLSLDRSAKGYLPSLPIDPAITVRELLDHTSGLRDFYFGAGVDHALLSKPARVWDPARSFKYVGKPFSKPGARMALLEHELPRPRDAGRSRRWRARGEPVA